MGSDQDSNLEGVEEPRFLWKLEDIRWEEDSYSLEGEVDRSHGEVVSKCGEAENSCVVDRSHGYEVESSDEVENSYVAVHSHGYEVENSYGEVVNSCVVEVESTLQVDMLQEEVENTLQEEDKMADSHTAEEEENKTSVEEDKVLKSVVLKWIGQGDHGMEEGELNDVP